MLTLHTAVHMPTAAPVRVGGSSNAEANDCNGKMVLCCGPDGFYALAALTPLDAAIASSNCNNGSTEIADHPSDLGAT